jgi:hypothetical protein
MLAAQLSMTLRPVSRWLFDLNITQMSHFIAGTNPGCGTKYSSSSSVCVSEC